MKDDVIEKLLSNNKAWSERLQASDPQFFSDLAQGQEPEYLWLGCSDSRVPAEQITNMAPGSMFVHRNIANVVGHTDVNTLSVVNFAVTSLKIKHIIVCGHYACGGVQAALSHKSFGFLDNWLMHIKDVYQQHSEELLAISDPDEQTNRLVELNVQEQVRHLGSVSFIQDIWAAKQSLAIHGLVYDLKTGLLKDLQVSLHNIDELQQAYRLKSD